MHYSETYKFSIRCQTSSFSFISFCNYLSDFVLIYYKSLYISDVFILLQSIEKKCKKFKILKCMKVEMRGP